MKNRIVSLFAVLLILSSLFGCASVNSERAETLSVVTTIFPLYDFARNLLKDKATVTLLLKPGAEIHGYEPTLGDMNIIKNADLVLYCSGESEEFIEDIKSQFDESKFSDVRQGLSLLQEETVEGMETEDEDEPEADEHVWTSPIQAIAMVNNILQKLKQVCPTYEDEIEENAKAYIRELNKLNDAFSAAVEDVEHPTIVVADRFPYRYLTEEYGIAYYAAFSGCSSDSDPTLSSMMFLKNLVKEKQFHTIFVTETSNQQYAQVIASENDAKVVVLHSCHNRSKEETKQDVTYLQLMQDNAKKLREAFHGCL